MAAIGDKKTDTQWLDGEREDPEAFGQTLAGKLTELTSTSVGPGANLHYNNVAIAYTHLYGCDMEGKGANAALVTRSGDQGNIAELRIPASAGLLHKAFNIVVGPELTWSAVATTTDFASEAEAVTARNALQYYWQHEGVGAEAKAAKFESMAFAEGALHIPWDKQAGEPAGVEPVGEGENAKERLVYTGAIAYRRASTWDIIRDPSAKSFKALKWLIVREWPDRHDVAASCDTEEKRQACLTADSSAPAGQAWMPFRTDANSNTARIPVYYLYCDRTPSVPAGRQTIFLGDGTVLEDGPLDEAYVGQLPVVRSASGEYRGSPWPYSKWFGTLGAGQARDALFRDLLTNATAVSGNVISVEDDAVDQAQEVATGTGPRVVPRPKGSPPPVALQLQQSHPEHFKLAATLGNEQQQIMGIDNITAGIEVGANLSGAAMALMTSTSVQNNSQEQADWKDFVQAIGNVTLRHIQFHMKTPKRIALAGNARSSLVTTTEVSGKSVQGIERVLVTIGSALEQTDAGKYDLAVEALKNGWAKTPEQFQTVRDTGRLDALTEDLSNELLLIKHENEALAKGEDVPVMLDDDHKLHLKGHPAVTSSITARRDLKVVTAVQAHQDAHLRVLRETDPAILALFGQPAIAPAAPPGGDPGVPGAPRPPQEAQQAQAPSMPKNPATGEKAGPVAGAPPPALAIKPN